MYLMHLNELLATGLLFWFSLDLVNFSLGQGKGFGVLLMSPRGSICVGCVERVDFDRVTFMPSTA